jgi:uncharacterized protein
MFTHISNLKKASLFFCLATALTLAVVLIFRFVLPQSEMVILVHMLTPLLATLIMLFVITGDGAKGDGNTPLGLTRSGRQVWGLAVLLPLPILAVSYGLAWASGMAVFTAPTESGWIPDLLINLVINFLIITLFVLSEEIGFRGYLLPRMQELGDKQAIILSGFLHGVWHLPLILLTPFYLAEGNRLLTVPLFLLLLTAAGAIYGTLWLATGSLWPGVILHGAFNVFLGLFTTLTVMRSPLAIYMIGESGVLTLVLTAVAAFWIMQRWPVTKVHGLVGFVDKGESVNPVNPQSTGMK